jgi:hypothetical protein
LLLYEKKHGDKQWRVESNGRGGRNIKKATSAAKKKRTIAPLPRKTQAALGKQAANVASEKRAA